jgi:hypothetical protein
MNSRRDFLRITTALAAMPVRADTAAAGNPIVRENALPGTRDWLLTNTRVDPATKYRCPWIEGYCSQTSVRAGGKISFHVSTNPASRFTLDLFRLGYYGGDGGRLVRRLGPFEGRVQEDPPVGPKRVRDCAWEACAEITIPDDWVSGVYLGKLTAEREGLQSYVIFIVRDDRKADFLFQCSDTTWQAYNRWPSQFALYDDGEAQWYWGGDVQVSFNRPYGKYCQIFDVPLSTGSGEFLLWEFPLAFWLESIGADVSYIRISTPIAILPACAAPRVSFPSATMSIGAARCSPTSRPRSAGPERRFFSGNAICGRILFDERARAFERIGVFGPPGGMNELKGINKLAHDRPYANELIGAHSTGVVTGGADWTCVLPDHWLFAGTGMKMGDGVPGLVGWEWHGDPAPIPG